MGRLFGTAGVRGDIKAKVTPELTLKAGLSLATYLGNKGSVVVGADNRSSSPPLKEIFKASLMLGGCKAIDVGMAPTPCLAYATRSLKADSGAMITASHNPPSDNGWKLFNADGSEYVPEQEEAIEGLVFNAAYKPVSWDAIGEPEDYGRALAEYSEALLATLEPLRRRLRVLVDCGNGVGSLVTPSVLSRLGCEVISLNADIDPRFPSRPLEPTPENLRETALAVAELKADIGFAHDGDADRLAVIDERGRYVNNDTVLAFFAKLMLQRHGKGRIITSVDTSFRIDEVAAAYGGVVERTRLGKTHAPLHGGCAEDIVLCCEPWKIIDPKWGYWGDAIYAASQLVKSLEEFGGTASEMFKGIPDHPQERFSIEARGESKEKIVEAIKGLVADEKGVASVWGYDGVRVNYSDGSWFLIRPSGTEEKVRVYCEAHSWDRLQELKRRCMLLIERAK